jgi:hypothetical protein
LIMQLADPETQVSSLPSVIQRETIYIKNVKKNPIVDLCTKLSTYLVKHGQVYKPPRGESKSIKLFQTIGYCLPRRNFDVMRKLSHKQWKTIEECWIANMHTVILHPMFDPNRIDTDLTRSIRSYKRWFIIFFTHAKTIRKDGKRRYVLLNLDKGLRALKTIAGYMQFYCCYDQYMINKEPPALPFYRGYHDKLHVLIFTWFGGYLRPFRRCDRLLNDQELIALCQMRTFGRALPCPSRNMCREDLKDQIKILTTERVVTERTLSDADAFCNQLGQRLRIDEMPFHTHFSMSTSGCYEVTSKEGGQAAYIRRNYMPIVNSRLVDCRIVLNPNGAFKPIYSELPLWDLYKFLSTGELSIPMDGEMVKLSKDENPMDFVDCYGNLLFPMEKIGRRSRGTSGLSGGEPGLSQVLYRLPKGAKREIFLQRTYGADFKGKVISQEVGMCLLLCATAESYLQGHFEDLEGNVCEPDAFIVCKETLQLPIWHKRRILRYKVDIPPKVKLTCLAEPGAKTRPLGNTQVWFNIIQRTMRFMVEPIIARDGRARIGLVSSNKMWSFLKFLQKKGYTDVYLQSTDYKSSTDFIPLSVIQAIWTGLTRIVRKNHPFMVFLDLIISNRMLELLAFDEISGQTGDMIHRCGSFMGEPMSFMTLTVINILIEEVTQNRFFAGMPPTVKDPVAICGDDFLSVRRILAVILLFKEIAEQFGMVFSWKDQISKRIGIFCEDHIIFNEDKGVIEYIDVIKSRLVTTMTRQHSDNRSSILGKGRMLRNQLDYFENAMLKEHIMNVYTTIFDRAYRLTVKQSDLPIWLPPSCGGIGFPILETNMPNYAYKYIKHVFDILDIKDPFEKYLKLSHLRCLNEPSKKGISTWDATKKVLGTILKKYEIHQYDGNISQVEISPWLVYSEQVIIDLLSDLGKDVAPDPYDPSKKDFDQMKNEASLIGIIPFADLSNEIERIQNFESFLREDNVRTQRTFKSFAYNSKKYWRSNGIPINRSNSGVTVKDVPKFTTWVDLEKRVNRSNPGWIVLSSTGLNMFNCSPSLKIDFLKYRKHGIDLNEDIRLSKAIRENHDVGL